MVSCVFYFLFFFFKQKTAYEMRISDWSSDVCSSDLNPCTDGAESDKSARLKCADHITQLSRLPDVEHLRHHVQLDACILVLAKARIAIAVDRIDIRNVAFYRNGSAHRVTDSGGCHDQQIVQPHLVQVQSRSTFSRVFVYLHIQPFSTIPVPHEGLGPPQP